MCDMRYLSLFSGIEAASAAWAPLGWECVAVAEIDPFPCAVLAHYHPNVPNLGDVSKLGWLDIAALGPIDLVVFGSPCQDLSLAGNRKGLAGARSGLFHVAMDIVGWARQYNGCRFALWENVPGAFSSNAGADFACVVGQMAGLDDLAAPKNGWGTEGCAVGDHGMLEWAVLDAQWFGVAQRRRRVFALADFGDWEHRPPLLLEPHSMRGDPPTRIVPGQEPAPTLAGGARRDGGYSYDDIPLTPTVFDETQVTSPENRSNPQPGDPCHPLVAHGRPPLLAFGGNNTSGPIDVATTVTAHPSGRYDFDTDTFVCATGDVIHTLTANGFDASEDGSGRGTPIITQPMAFSCKDFGGDFGPVAPTLRSMGHNGSHANGGGQVAVVTESAVAFAVRTANTSANGHGVAEEVAHTLDSANGQGVIAFDARQSDVCVYGDKTGPLMTDGGTIGVLAFQSSQSGVRLADVHCTLDANNGTRRHNGVITRSAVRRLTPRECERLQGFKDDYTAIPFKGKPAADGVRYKALGNSMAVPVMGWIGMQLQFYK